ncbi:MULTISPECIES: AraC family transcriptional regulator [Colwellia]|uniref:Transcriptional regulator, AraC family n=1 Tax=Colwellia psychrerythraea (strain 34H / ATCC BAA-681) TaxID=167879 RepID=Q481J4_COLP3|nr:MULTISPECIES: AraC family transcriptional regulator [Colwellia]AAZ27202.1 transcriptional regulator, AraC family [Colwellia psychrerythraea 34H]PKH87550.1 AraC family transcriptional regulator [Colwellia sp. Bg11-28]
MSQTTLSTIPRLIGQVLSIYDVAPEAIFSAANIDITSDAQTRVPMENMATLWKLAVEATHNNELGLVAASLFQPVYLKSIGLAWLASENLEEGLKRYIASSQLINTEMQIELTERDGIDGEETLIQYQRRLTSSNTIKVHPCAIELGIGFFLKMFRLAAGKNIPATGVYFTFAIEENNKVYEEYFQCPVYGNQAVNGIAFSKALLTETLPTHDVELVEMNEVVINKHLDSMDNGETSSKVIKMINDLLPLGCPTEEVIAYKLHMSKRTLQRKLSVEKQSFLALLTSVRLMLAKEKLANKRVSVTEITYQLGYSSPSTFARAFKKHTQLSPLEYRNQVSSYSSCS